MYKLALTTAIAFMLTAILIAQQAEITRGAPDIQQIGLWFELLRWIVAAFTASFLLLIITLFCALVHISYRELENGRR